MTDYSQRVKIPPYGSFNVGLNPCHQQTMLDVFGRPGALTRDCSLLTNERLLALIQTRNVGPFRLTGLARLLDILEDLLAQVRTENAELYGQIRNDGMICCRAVRGSAEHFSNHSWGSAIDLRFGNQSEEMGDGTMHLGTGALAPYFNARGWYWGAGFGATNPSREDSMHFEASDELIRKLYGGGNGGSPAVPVNHQPAAAGASSSAGALKSKELSGVSDLEAVAAGHSTIGPAQSKSAAVAALQNAFNQLAVLRPDYAIDLGDGKKFAGYYGPKTVQAVRIFQSDHGIPVSGEVDAATIHAVDVTLTAITDGTIPRATPVGPAGGGAAGPGPRPTGPGRTPVGNPTPWRTGSGYAHDKDHPEKGWARTTGISGTSTRFDDGSVELEGAETLTAVRGTHDFGSVMAKQRRTIRNGEHHVVQENYCWGGRPLPDALFKERAASLEGSPGVHYLYSTQFGKSDDQDEGTGSQEFGIAQTSSEVCGCSVPASRLEEWFGADWPTNARRLHAMVEVFYPRTSRYVRVPLTDVGPSPSVRGKIDLTWAVDQFLGTDGGDYVYFRLDPTSVA